VQARLNQAERRPVLQLKGCHHPLHSLAAPSLRAIFPLLLLGKPAGRAKSRLHFGSCHVRARASVALLLVLPKFDMLQQQQALAVHCVQL